MTTLIIAKTKQHAADYCTRNRVEASYVTDARDLAGNRITEVFVLTSAKQRMDWDELRLRIGACKCAVIHDVG